MRTNKNMAERYQAKAERFQKDGNAHWAQAKNGGHPGHYGCARKAYAKAEEYRNLAESLKKR